MSNWQDLRFERGPIAPARRRVTSTRGLVWAGVAKTAAPAWNYFRTIGLDARWPAAMDLTKEGLVRAIEFTGVFDDGNVEAPTAYGEGSIRLVSAASDSSEVASIDHIACQEAHVLIDPAASAFSIQFLPQTAEEWIRDGSLFFGLKDGMLVTCIAFPEVIS